MTFVSCVIKVLSSVHNSSCFLKYSEFSSPLRWSALFFLRILTWNFPLSKFLLWYARGVPVSTAASYVFLPIDLALDERVYSSLCVSWWLARGGVRGRTSFRDGKTTILNRLKH